MRISSAHIDKTKVEEVYSNFAHEFRKAVISRRPAVLLFDGKDVFDFATSPELDDLVTVKA
mgnify:CR=1 FL=1